MYNDFRNTGRDNWKYPYAGRDLLAAAKRKLAEFAAKERDARERLAKLLMDPAVASSSSAIAECRKHIEQYGDLAERCSVFVHEFNRMPDREFFLALGDVTFFDLCVTPATAAV